MKIAPLFFRPPTLIEYYRVMKIESSWFWNELLKRAQKRPQDPGIIIFFAHLLIVWNHARDDLFYSIIKRALCSEHTEYCHGMRSALLWLRYYDISSAQLPKLVSYNGNCALMVWFYICDLLYDPVFKIAPLRSRSYDKFFHALLH